MSIDAQGLAKRNIRTAVALSLMAVVLVFLFILDLVTGSVKIPASYVVNSFLNIENGDQLWDTILFDFRVPKALTAIAAGAALSVSGLQMQTVFRNPLAGPDVLGISSGASLGVALVVMGFGNIFSSADMPYLSSWVQIMAACAGSVAVLFIIMAVAMRVRDIMTILILGILFGSAVSAIVSIIQYFSEQSVLKTFIVWTMGNLGSLTRPQLNVLLLSVLSGLMLTIFSIKKLNLLLAGETYARSLGVNIKAARFLVFISTGILTGSITAFCGPIGFVGIAVPHIVRTLLGSSDHRLTVQGCILAGGILLLSSDLLSQIPGDGTILPVNAVTSILGIPVVIWVVLRNRKFSGIS